MRVGRPPEGLPWRIAPAPFAVLATLLLALLCAHAWRYRFQCDDAFISFRYARNLAHGHGLVFNPGLERVEGYTDFLWVVLLAAFDRVGLAPERSANVLSFAATIALWAGVLWWSMRRFGASVLALVPVLLLALTRSVAVWSTSGLETRLYELLLVGGVLRTVVEIEPLPEGGRGRRPFAGWLLGLAALTRPESVLLGPAVVLVAAWRLHARGGRALPWLVATLAPLLGLIGAHVAFRRMYYGAWVPNTYFAKVGGRLRLDWGLPYLAAFALEYGVLLWLPLLWIGGRRMLRVASGNPARGAADAAILFAVLAMLLMTSVAAIGGDHFEYRPLDTLFPFAYLVVGEGVAALAIAPRRRALVVPALLALGYGIVDLPLRSHLEFPAVYAGGFPGRDLDTSQSARDFLAPEADPVLGLPGLRAIASAHQALTRTLTFHFVALRQEEHRLFLEASMAQAKRVRALVDQGVLARDARIADDCVGAIPYVSDLLVLDRHGLTDAVVAHRPPRNSGIMAHEKSATWDDATRFGVELWPAAPVDLVQPLTSLNVLYALTHPSVDSHQLYMANVEPDGVLIAVLPLGPAHVAARMPALRLMSAADTAFQRAYVMRATPAFLARIREHPNDLETMNAFAYLLFLQQRAGEALTLYQEIVRQVPGDAGVWERIAACQQLLERPGEERAALERARDAAGAMGDGARVARVAARLEALANAKR